MKPAQKAIEHLSPFIYPSADPSGGILLGRQASASGSLGQIPGANLKNERRHNILKFRRVNMVPNQEETERGAEAEAISLLGLKQLMQQMIGSRSLSSRWTYYSWHPFSLPGQDYPRLIFEALTMRALPPTTEMRLNVTQSSAPYSRHTRQSRHNEWCSLKSLILYIQRACTLCRPSIRYSLVNRLPDLAPFVRSS